MKDSPFWAASLFVHLMIFILLAASFIYVSPVKHRTRHTLVISPDTPEVSIKPFVLPSDDAITKPDNNKPGVGNTWCGKRAGRIWSALKSNQQSKEKYPMHWLAHAQITIAELLRRRYILNQYILCLRQDGRKIKSIPPRHRVVIQRSNRMRGGRRSVREFEDVKKSMERVFSANRDTPWETLVRRMGGRLFPGLELRITPIPKSRRQIARPRINI